MNKINFFVVADNAEVRGGKIYIEGIFDSINSNNYPAKHRSFIIAINFEIVPGRHSHSFIIKNDVQDIIKSPTFDFDVLPNSTRHQFLHRVNDLPIPKEGKYIVEAYVDDKLIGETYFIAKTTSQSNYA
jgi:sulfur carrier protein ThiS